MSLRWTRTGNWHIARFPGGNLENCEGESEALKAFVADLPPGCRVAISFRGVQWISSRVVGMILGARTAVEQREGKFAITSPSARVMEILRLTHLDRALNIKESTNDLE